MHGVNVNETHPGITREQHDNGGLMADADIEQIERTGIVAGVPFGDERTPAEYAARAAYHRAQAEQLHPAHVYAEHVQHAEHYEKAAQRAAHPVNVTLCAWLPLRLRIERERTIASRGARSAEITHVRGCPYRQIVRQALVALYPGQLWSETDTWHGVQLNEHEWVFMLVR